MVALPSGIRPILSQPTKFPDNGRTKVRVSFPSDYAFTTDGGLDLAAGMKARIDAVSPAP